MDSQTFIEYEVVDQVKDISFITKSFDEAEESFNEGMAAFENHITVCSQTLYSMNINRSIVQWK